MCATIVTLISCIPTANCMFTYFSYLQEESIYKNNINLTKNIYNLTSEYLLQTVKQLLASSYFVKWSILFRLLPGLSMNKHSNRVIALV